MEAAMFQIAGGIVLGFILLFLLIGFFPIVLAALGAAIWFVIGFAAIAIVLIIAFVLKDTIDTAEKKAALAEKCAKDPEFAAHHEERQRRKKANSEKRRQDPDRIKKIRSGKVKPGK
jgi:hypothetical protein